MGRAKVTCRNCGWVHLAYTKEEAAEGGWYRDTCYSCGARDFRPYNPNDAAPRGATLQAVVIRQGGKDSP